MANSKSDSDSETDLDLDSDEEVEVSNLRIPAKVSKYIDELYLNLKTSLKRIFELKMENSKLKQQEISWNEKFENLDKIFIDLKENADSLSKENIFLNENISNITKKNSK